VDAQGIISREVMPDLLHPSALGYERMADALAPTLAELLAER
jgi:lysophospholipase L1-like esterase